MGLASPTRRYPGGVRLLLVTLTALAASYLALRAVPAPAPSDADPFPGEAPLVLAHRGGLALWPENTLLAFREALALGVDVLETDLRRTADGRLAVFHDARLERTTDGEGAVAERRWADLASLDAGHHFSRDGGRSFPYRGRGLRIPALEEVLAALPDARLSLELKDDTPETAAPLCALLTEHGAHDRVIVASFHQTPIDAVRERCPEVPTAATPGEAWRFYLASRLGLANLVRPRAEAVFLMQRLGPLRPASSGLVADAAALGLPVYVWGAEGEAEIRALLAAGVAGITTDHPGHLLAALGRGEPSQRE